MVKSLSYAAQNLRLIYRAPHPCPVLDALHGMQSHLLAHMNAESLGWFTSIPRVEQHLWEACCDLLRVVRVTLTVPGTIERLEWLLSVRLFCRELGHALAENEGEVELIDHLAG